MSETNELVKKQILVKKKILCSGGISTRSNSFERIVFFCHIFAVVVVVVRDICDNLAPRINFQIMKELKQSPNPIRNEEYA